jgi:hypothetical protein
MSQNSDNPTAEENGGSNPQKRAFRVAIGKINFKLLANKFPFVILRLGGFLTGV